MDTEMTVDERATELGCEPALVPIVERLDMIIGLLRRMPVAYTYHPSGATDALLRDLFPEGAIPPRQYTRP